MLESVGQAHNQVEGPGRWAKLMDQAHGAQS